jgi:hypothetical protein
MSLSDLMFALQPPADWEIRLQVTLIEPAAKPDPALPAALEQTAPPRANIVVSRHAARQSPREACEDFLKQTAMAIPQIEIGEIQAFTFKDGVEGVSVEISFPATPQVRLAQLHAFRIDRGLLAQIVGTSDRKERLGELLELIESFRPN